MKNTTSLNCILNCGFFKQANGEDNIGPFQRVYRRAKKKLKKILKKKSKGKERIDFDIKIEPTAENFDKIIRLFNECEKSKPHFFDSTPKWSLSRKDSISELRAYAKKIDLDRRNCNYTKVGSSSVGIVGGAVGVSALIFPPAAIPLTIAGLVTAGVSGATTVGTSITEMVLLNKCMKKAKTVLETDRDNFKPMSRWFERAAELTNLIDEIIGFDVAKDIYQGLKDCKIGNENLLRTKEGELHPILNDLVDQCVEKMTLEAFAAAATKEVLSIIPSAIAFFFVAILLHRKNNFMLGCVVASHRLALGLMKIFDLGSDLGLTISNIAMKSGVVATREVSKATAKMIAQGFVFGLGLGLDIANLILTSKDIHKGSKSKKAEDINTVADRLESELEIIESIYTQLGGEPYETLPVNQTSAA